jgi:hypothetical protein
VACTYLAKDGQPDNSARVGAGTAREFISLFWFREDCRSMCDNFTGIAYRRLFGPRESHNLCLLVFLLQVPPAVAYSVLAIPRVLVTCEVTVSVVDVLICR